MPTLCQNSAKIVRRLEYHNANFLWVRDGDTTDEFVFIVNWAKETERRLSTPAPSESLEVLIDKQKKYVISCGGFNGIKEADEIYNDLNREIIKAYKEKFGSAVLGSYLYYGDEAERIKTGLESPYTEYTVSSLGNFSCNFILREEDSQVTELICLWNSSYAYRGKIFDELVARVEALGGRMLIWF